MTGRLAVLRVSDADMPPLEEPLIEDGATEEESSAVSSSNFVRGLLFACTVGAAGGSILVPMHYVTDAASGIVFIPSFGIGVLAAAPVVTAFYSIFVENLMSEELHIMPCLPVGILSGSIWNLGNALSIVGIAHLGYGVAYPLMQCALVFSGLWGIFVFKEIQGRAVRVFFAFCVVVLGGAALLTISIKNS